jgi:hypothetical protein
MNKIRLFFMIFLTYSFKNFKCKSTKKKFILLFLNVHQRIDKNRFLQVIDARVCVRQSKYVQNFYLIIELLAFMKQENDLNEHSKKKIDVIARNDVF